MEIICFNCESREFAHRIEECARNREDVTLWGVDYTALPVDADGVPIRVGDVMAYADNAKPMKVVALVPPAVFLTEDGPRYANMYHHRAPTVEDVLREFVERLDEIGSEDDCAGVEEQECRACIRRDIAAVYAEYAAKLRLAGDE